MPVRDGAQWIAAACRSVLSQSHRSFELVIIDDGSRDGTVGQIEALTGDDPRIRLIRQPALGIVGALNRGLDVARAPYVARLDADDLAMPNRLARQIEVLEKQPDVVLLGSWAERIDASGHPRGLLRPETLSDRLFAQLQRRNPFVHSSVMMRTDVARRVGGYREVCRHAEDYDLWLRLSEAGVIAIIPEVLVRLRVHPDSISHRKALDQCFAARIARRAATVRRQTGHDPLASLDAVPDWWIDECLPRCFDEDVSLARFLDDHPPAMAGNGTRAIPPADVFAGLGHQEKRLARRAIRRLLLAPPGSHGLSRAGLLVQGAHGLASWRLLRLRSRHAEGKGSSPLFPDRG